MLRLTYARASRSCRPDTEAVMVLRRQTAPRHIGGFSRCGPLIRIQASWIEQICGRSGIAPFPILKGGHIEMHKHAKAQVEKLLLQLKQRLAAPYRRFAPRFASRRSAL